MKNINEYQDLVLTANGWFLQQVWYHFTQSSRNTAVYVVIVFTSK